MLVVTDYKILTETSYYSLVSTVQYSIRDGWQPLGGVSVCLHATSGNSYESAKDFYQTMVKYAQPKSNSI